MTKHTAYKKSEISWLDIIPEHWKIARIKDALSRTFTGAWGDEPTEDNSYLCVRVADFNANMRRVSFADSPTYRSYSSDVISNKKLRNKDILLEKSGGGEKVLVGRVVMWEDNIVFGDTLCANFVQVLRINNKIVLPEYLVLVLSTIHTKNIVRYHIKQTTGIQNLSFNSYLNEYIPIPTIAEQKTIVAYLDRETEHIDHIVALLTKQRKRYDQLKRALISEVIAKGLPHHDPTTFRTFRLKSLGNITSAGVDKKVNEDDQAILMLNYLDIYKSKTFSIESNEGFMEVTATQTQIENKDVKRGDVFFTPSSETIEDIGVSAVILNDLPNTVYSYHIVRFRPYHQNLLVAEFCKYLFNNESVQLYMSSNAKGTTRKILNIKVFENLTIALPTLAEQEEIVAYLDERCGRIDRLTAAIYRKIELLGTLKKSLIEEVVTGKRRVTNE